MDEASSMKADDIKNSPEYRNMRIKLGLDKEPKPSRLYSLRIKLSDIIWMRALVMRLFRR